MGYTNLQDTILDTIVIVANILSFVYNLPQIYQTIKTKKADDISGLFLIIRLVSSIMWIIYTTIRYDLQVLISWLITFSSSAIIIYYKFFYVPNDDTNTSQNEDTNTPENKKTDTPENEETDISENKESDNTQENTIIHNVIEVEDTNE